MGIPPLPRPARKIQQLYRDKCCLAQVFTSGDESREKAARRRALRHDRAIFTNGGASGAGRFGSSGLPP